MQDYLQCASDYMGFGIENVTRETFALGIKALTGVIPDMDRVIAYAEEYEGPEDFAMKYSMMLEAGEVL